MRRSRVAVSGIVCALVVESTLLAGCRSQEEETQRLAVKEAPKKLEVQKLAEPKPPLEKRAAAEPSKAPPPVASSSPPGNNFGAKMKLAPQGSVSHQLGAPLGIGGLGTKGAGAGGGGGIGSLGGASQGYASGRGSASVAYGSGSASFNGRAAVGHKYKAASNTLPSSADTQSQGEGYRDAGINPFVTASEDRLSTFAIDVDTGAYTLARRKIIEGSMPAQEGVRVEEFLNYFRYDYAGPTDGSPLAVHMDAAPSPYTPGRHLLRVGVQGKQLSVAERKPAHLTFLVDVSGSMQSPDKLPLAQRALRMLVDNLRDGDTVAMVTYAGNVKVALRPTGMEKKAVIHQAIEELQAGGSTAMSSGIELAYQQAMKTVSDKSISRVIILSDGDANVGNTSPEGILKLIRGYVKEGITVTTVGFGMGNYKDDMMERFANQGNGNHYYVDSLMAARRIFQEQIGGTLEVIAQDVMLQVDFDPEQVARYRLVGYENRAIADALFRDDKVDAGELGAGRAVPPQPARAALEL